MKGVFVIITACCLLQACMGESQEKRLLQILLSKYTEFDLIARPVENHNDTVLVKLGMAVVDIVEVEDDHNTLKVAGWVTQSWVDPKLQWNPDDYGGVEEIAFPHKMSWSPDIKLFNRVNLDDDIFKDEMKIAYADGTVVWVPRGKLKIKCRSSKKNKKQMLCKFNIGSWVYNQNQLDLAFFDREDIDMSSYQPDPHWDVVATSAERESQIYPNAPDPYVMMHFNIILEPREKKPKVEKEKPRPVGEQEDPSVAEPVENTASPDPTVVMKKVKTLNEELKEIMEA